MTNKLIILTPSIIRGNFHSRSIGKFYEFFYQYFKSNYEIYHIINIDEPKNLKKYFNKYETMGIYNSIIPSEVNTIFINEPNPGFLHAWKKIVSKIEELDLINDKYLYYWLEDDWEPRVHYDITQFFDLLQFPNTAYTFTNGTPLGSFRGGPFMTGSYFLNIFNIRKYMNNTCDPERQMQRWLRGGYQKNGNSSIHRFKVQDDDVVSKLIQIIIVCEESNVNIGDLNIHHYKAGFDKSIKFEYHLITRDDNWNLRYSLVDNSNKYNLIKINQEELNKIFSNTNIKYFIIKPSIMFDIGREFNAEYGLQKWMKIEDNTGYADIKFYETNVGNDLGLEEKELRLKPELTSNIDFILEFENIINCMPYLEKEYFNKGINPNINYYSHLYGTYPNFNVFGDLIQLNYIPTINKSNDQIDKLNCLKKNNTLTNINLSIDEKNNYVHKYFKFNKNIINEVNEFVKNNFYSNTMGINCANINNENYEEKIKNIKQHLTNNKWVNVYLFVNNSIIKNMLIEDLSEYNLIFYKDTKFDKNASLNKTNEIICEIKNTNDVNKLVELECGLKNMNAKNIKIFQNIIISYLILLKSNLII